MDHGLTDEQAQVLIKIAHGMMNGPLSLEMVEQLRLVWTIHGSIYTGVLEDAEARVLSENGKRLLNEYLERKHVVPSTSS